MNVSCAQHHPTVVVSVLKVQAHRQESSVKGALPLTSLRDKAVNLRAGVAPLQPKTASDALVVKNAESVGRVTITSLETVIKIGSLDR